MIKDKERLFYSAKEIGDISNLGERTILRCILNKNIPAVKVGGVYQIPKSFAEKLLKEWSKTGMELKQ